MANMDFETCYATLELQFGAGLKEVIHATGFIGHILAIEFARRLGQSDANESGFLSILERNECFA
jgi:hypothetical protein